jgi:hypothetical protein
MRRTGMAITMKNLAPLCFALFPVLAACETTRAPTPAELFAGQAIISVNASTGRVTEAYHRQMLEKPIDTPGNDVCQVATTDEVVAAVNDIVRQAWPLPRDAKFVPEGFEVAPGVKYPAGSPLIDDDVVGTLLIDSQGRSVTLGDTTDWDGNQYMLTDAEGEEIDRIIDFDSVYRQCTAQVHEWKP